MSSFNIYFPNDGYAEITSNETMSAGTVVKFSGGGDAYLVQAQDYTDDWIGVLIEDVETSGTAKVRLRGPVVKVIATGTIEATEVVELYTNGTVVSQANNEYTGTQFGTAMNLANDGETLYVVLAAGGI
jgi:hypothetical protein